MNDWNVRNVSGATGVTGVPLEGLVAGMPGMSLEGLVRHTDGISRRSPCLLCVEFLELDCSTRRALCLLHVELDSEWRILWIVV